VRLCQVSIINASATSVPAAMTIATAFGKVPQPAYIVKKDGYRRTSA